MIKFSMTEGKGTLAGPFKILRSIQALNNCQTVVGIDEAGKDAMVTYFNGANVNEPFGAGQYDDFPTIKARIANQMKIMPLTLATESNKGYPASTELLNKREALREQYVHTQDAFKA